MKLNHTRSEHREAILALARRHVELGLSPDDAIAKAGAEWRETIKANGEAKADEVLRWLKRTASN